MAAFWLGSSLGNRRQKPVLFPFPRVTGPTKKSLLVYYVLGFFTERGAYVFHKMGASGLFFSWAQALGSLTLPQLWLSIYVSPSFPLVQAAPPFCLFSWLHLCFEAFTPPGGSCHESGWVLCGHLSLVYVPERLHGQPCLWPKSAAIFKVGIS